MTNDRRNVASKACLSVKSRSRKRRRTRRAKRFALTQCTFRFPLRFSRALIRGSCRKPFLGQILASNKFLFCYNESQSRMTSNNSSQPRRQNVWTLNSNQAGNVAPGTKFNLKIKFPRREDVRAELDVHSRQHSVRGSLNLIIGSGTWMHTRALRWCKRQFNRRRGA